MDILHRAIAVLGGKKLCALGIGVIMYVLYHKTGITPDQASAVVADAGKVAASSDLQSLLTTIAAYCVGQGLADGLSGGKTSSAAILAAAANKDVG